MLYSYNNCNQLEAQFIYNMSIRYEYTKYGQLKTKILGGESKPVSRLEYIYTKDGQISARLAYEKFCCYAYDKKGQLTAVLDILTNKPVKQYVCDPVGNMLIKTVNGKTTTYKYDAANQPVTSMTDGKERNYKYDAAGRLVQKVFKNLL